MAESGKPPILDFGSGCDLRVLRQTIRDSISGDKLRGAGRWRR